jgi:uncharacterized protein with PIN domain
VKNGIPDKETQERIWPYIRRWQITPPAVKFEWLTCPICGDRLYANSNEQLAQFACVAPECLCVTVPLDLKLYQGKKDG